jgi:hypothetical protein
MIQPWLETMQTKRTTVSIILNPNFVLFVLFVPFVVQADLSSLALFRLDTILAIE